MPRVSVSPGADAGDVRYVALLRGLNVGGKAIVRMADLKACFAEAGYRAVETYIASGNVLFAHPPAAATELAGEIEPRLRRRFGLDLPVLVKTADEMRSICAAVPPGWTNDAEMRTDVLFLWPEVDDPSVLRELPANPAVERPLYTPGAVIWGFARRNHGRSRMARIVGTPIYRKLTGRNVNTARTLAEKLAASTPEESPGLPDAGTGGALAPT